jgi:hypothetical protein
MFIRDGSSWPHDSRIRDHSYSMSKNSSDPNLLSTSTLHHHHPAKAILPRAGSVNNISGTAGYGMDGNLMTTTSGHHTFAQDDSYTPFTRHQRAGYRRSLNVQTREHEHEEHDMGRVEGSEPLRHRYSSDPAAIALGLDELRHTHDGDKASRNGRSAFDGILNSQSGEEISWTFRYNARLADHYKEYSLGHVWKMLSVCFDVMSVTGYGDETIQSGSNKKESCRRMVMSGLSTGWGSHALGRPLLRGLFRHLCNVGDLQTAATITCCVGGAKVLAYLLDEPSLHTSLSLDRMLLR